MTINESFNIVHDHWKRIFQSCFYIKFNISIRKSVNWCSQAFVFRQKTWFYDHEKISLISGKILLALDYLNQFQSSILHFGKKAKNILERANYWKSKNIKNTHVCRFGSSVITEKHTKEDDHYIWLNVSPEARWNYPHDRDTRNCLMGDCRLSEICIRVATKGWL